MSTHSHSHAAVGGRPDSRIVVPEPFSQSRASAPLRLERHEVHMRIDGEQQVQGNAAKMRSLRL